jgi:hypothetical protein
MSEEILGGNQTTTEPVTQEPSSQEPTQTQEPVTTQEPNYFTVKYNKEEHQVSYDEAPDYIQKGMNYDKVNQRVGEYEQQLNRVAQLSGYNTHDELLAALDEIEQQQERERYEQAGIDPDQFQQLVSELPEIKQFREIQKQQEETKKFESEVSELFSEFPDLKPEQIPPEAWQLKESKGLSLLDSYLRVSYKSLGQQKEQEAIQKLQGNAQSSPGPLGGGDVNHNTNISTLSSKDFGSLVDQVLRGERKQL